MAHRRSYPPGSWLRCVCGREGTVRSIATHRAVSKDAVCRGRPTRIPAPASAREGERPPAQKALESGIVTPQDDKVETGVENETPPMRGTPTAVSDDLHPDVEGGEGGGEPLRFTARNLRLRLATYAYYEAARASFGESAQGSFEDFLDSIVAAYFHLIGYRRGIRLVADDETEVTLPVTVPVESGEQAS